MIIFFCSALNTSFSQPSSHFFINPTGTYILKGEKHKGEIKGNFAEVRVKLLGDSLLALSLYSNNGYPQYASGSFIDTLKYINNRAIYSSKSGEFCQIVFSFVLNGLNINQVYGDPSSTCGFGKGVIPLGLIEKHSSFQPIIQSLSR